VILVVSTVEDELLSELDAELVTNSDELGDIQTRSSVDDSCEDLEEIRWSISSDAVGHNEGLDGELRELSLEDVKGLAEVVVVHQLLSLDLGSSFVASADEVGDLALGGIGQILFLLFLQSHANKSQIALCSKLSRIELFAEHLSHT